MMRTCLLVALLLVIVGFSPANGDIYKYRDTNGVVRYTYDLAEVPEDQRPQVKTYEETPTGPETSPQETGETGEDRDTSNETIDEEVVVDEKTIEELNQRKKELDEEFAELMEEKYSLLKDKENLQKSLAGRDTVAVAGYDKKVEELNRKIADYQKRREAFQKEAEAVKKAVEKPSS
jgi:predicted RNase H-like nuclease (RuvC/YqgF family)